MIMIPTNPNPQQLLDAYDDGYIGCYLDVPEMPTSCRRAARDSRDRLLEELPMPRVEDFASAIEGVGKDNYAYPWNIYLQADHDAMDGNQLTGDCTGWGVRCAGDVERACAVAAGEPEEYRARGATCMIYGARGRRGAGMAVSTAAQAMKDNGVLLELPYLDEKYDFRHYPDYYKLGMGWGGSGIPEDLLEVTRKNRVRTISSVNTMEAVQDLLQTGRAIAVGSMIGVARTGNPIARLKGSWSHCMAIVGYDARPETVELLGSPVYFWENSWGDWHDAKNLLPDWPTFGQGMFVLNETDTWRAIRTGDSWTFTSTDGFPARELNWLLI